MKIAIFYGGRILDYDRYYDKLKKFIIKDNDVDIFLSHSKELNEDLTGFIDLYKPKIVIDENIDYNGKPSPNNHNWICMVYNRYRIFQAFKKYCQEYGIHYDRIIVYRLDVLALSEIKFDTMDLIMDDDTIYIPNIVRGINDFMAIGNFNAIEKYSNLYLHYEDILNKYCIKNAGEPVLQIYLDTIKMKIVYFPYNCLLREDIRLNGGRSVRVSKEDIENLLKNDIKF